MTVTRTHLRPVESIVRAPECQGREELNSDVLQDYVDLYCGGTELPAPEVYDVGGTLYLVDGFHRLTAAEAAGREEIEVAIVGSGSFDEAVWYSTGVNQFHGLRRSNADKRRAVLNALRNPIGQEQSSRTIATHVGVSHDLVARMRREIEGRAVSSDDRPGPVSSDDTRAPHLSSDDRASGPRVEGDDRRPARPPTSSEPDVEQLGVLAQQLADASRDEEEADGVLRGARRSLMRIVERGGLLAHHIRGVADALLDHSRKLPQHTPVLHPECGGDGCRACDRRGYVLRMTAEGRR